MGFFLRDKNVGNGMEMGVCWNELATARLIVEQDKYLLYICYNNKIMMGL